MNAQEMAEKQRRQRQAQETQRIIQQQVNFFVILIHILTNLFSLKRRKDFKLKKRKETEEKLRCGKKE